MNNEIAKILLEIQAVKLSPNEFFTWSSGLRSPIYCDNRQLISIPKYRKFITQKFVSIIKDQFNEVELIAGTATAAIPWAAWIAHDLELPMIYIRNSSKQHGLKNSIEGLISRQQKVIIIEDLVSTGKSSINAAKEASIHNLHVLGVLSIFSYDLDVAKHLFTENKLPLVSLSNINSLLDFAMKEKLLTHQQIEIIYGWKQTITN